MTKEEEIRLNAMMSFLQNGWDQSRLQVGQLMGELAVEKEKRKDAEDALRVEQAKQVSNVVDLPA